jgi:hypothetical protein
MPRRPFPVAPTACLGLSARRRAKLQESCPVGVSHPGELILRGAGGRGVGAPAARGCSGQLGEGLGCPSRASHRSGSTSFPRHFRHLPRREWATYFQSFRRRENPSCHTPLAASRARPLHRRGLCLGPKAVAGQRGRPHSARRRGVARVKKKGQNYIFSLHIAKGKRRPVAGVGGTKIFWGRGEKKENTIFPPPHSHPTTWFVNIYSCQDGAAARPCGSRS